MSDFAASNSIRIGLRGGVVQWAAEGSDDFGDVRGYVVGSPLDHAMGEYYRATHDERLGRWRWPENPEYVVYPCSVKTRVRVLRESGTGDLEWVDQGDGRSYEFVHAARAYFDAHPEPKPWHDAQPGEVWILQFGDPMLDQGAYVAGDMTFIAADHGVPIDDHRVIAGRRIWPEVSA